MSKTHVKAAFTLIELLVVVAIMGMLIGLALPSLTRARQQAKETQCLSLLRSLSVSYMTYLHDHDRFPSLNNEDDDGAWQYNYLIYDGRDFEQNFGPMIADGSTLDDIKALFCPIQTDPYHTPGTSFNPWPVIRTQDTRAGWARRYHLTGKTLAQLKTTVAMASDLIHVPDVIRSAHKTGVNAVYTDGHARWVKDPGKMTHNDLATPFDRLNNEAIKDTRK
jgi:prepilin-type N-terminal cleavage/methylation domain-containing protein/prepilin-type processing-associated H-X9-DG protein